MRHNRRKDGFIAGTSNGLNILVADDEKLLAVLLSRVLKQAEHQVDVVYDGEDALSAITKEPARYHLVITDHRMRFTGLELVTGLRKIAFPGKILVLSGFLTTEVENAYRLLSVNSFVSKPFNPGSLLRTVLRLSVA